MRLDVKPVARLSEDERAALTARWLAFAGRLVVDQPTGRVVFTINRPMVLPGERPAPREGTIDLNGPPW